MLGEEVPLPSSAVKGDGLFRTLQIFKSYGLFWIIFIVREAGEIGIFTDYYRDKK